MRLPIIVLALLLASGAPAMAQAIWESLYQEGLNAYRQGDYQTAFRLWQRQSIYRDPDAAYGIALIYDNGLVGPRNHQAALEWYRFAAEYGSPEAAARLATGEAPR